MNVLFSDSSFSNLLKSLPFCRFIKKLEIAITVQKLLIENANEYYFKNRELSEMCNELRSLVYTGLTDGNTNVERCFLLRSKIRDSGIIIPQCESVFILISHLMILKSWLEALGEDSSLLLRGIFVINCVMLLNSEISVKYLYCDDVMCPQRWRDHFSGVSGGSKELRNVLELLLIGDGDKKGGDEPESNKYLYIPRCDGLEDLLRITMYPIELRRIEAIGVYPDNSLNREIEAWASLVDEITPELSDIDGFAQLVAEFTETRNALKEVTCQYMEKKRSELLEAELDAVSALSRETLKKVKSVELDFTKRAEQKVQAQIDQLRSSREVSECNSQTMEAVEGAAMLRRLQRDVLAESYQPIFRNVELIEKARKETREINLELSERFGELLAARKGDRFEDSLKLMMAIDGSGERGSEDRIAAVNQCIEETEAALSVLRRWSEERSEKIGRKEEMMHHVRIPKMKFSCNRARFSEVIAQSKVILNEALGRREKLREREKELLALVSRKGK
jgi:hypothetical protein